MHMEINTRWNTKQRRNNKINSPPTFLFLFKELPIPGSYINIDL